MARFFIARISYLATAASFSKITPSIGEAVPLAGSAAALSPELSTRSNLSAKVAADAKQFPHPIARSEIRSRAAAAVLVLDKREALSRT